MKRLIAFLPAFIALVAIVGIAIGLILPTFRRIQEIRAATMAEREQLEQWYQRSRARSRAALELTRREQALDELVNRIPLEEEALVVIRSIETIATAHQLEERLAINWNTAQTGNRVSDAPTTIEFTGSYMNLIAALRDLERLSLPPVIEQFEITSDKLRTSGEPTARARVQLVIRTNTFWRQK